MTRIVSLWLPSFATDRLRRQSPSGGTPAEGSARPPLATIAAGKGGLMLAAISGEARDAGLKPGLSLAEARAAVPALQVHLSDPAADSRALIRLADWCDRYTPSLAIDPDGNMTGILGSGAGLVLDISGCAHLFGGEAALLGDLIRRLHRTGFAAQAAVADTAGAAWAVARFGGAGFSVVTEGTTAEALAPLPMAGLRLPAATVADLGRAGLRRIGDLYALPRPPLAARYGDGLLVRLDQALGRLEEPFSPLRPAPPFFARLHVAEPIGRHEDIVAALRHLLDDLCGRLEAAHRGARRLELTCYRTDGTLARAWVGTGRPVRQAPPLMRLFLDKLDRLDAGFGIETMILAAAVVEPLPPRQDAIAGTGATVEADALGHLIDRLSNRLQAAAVVRLALHPSHIPERACREVPAMAAPLPSPSRCAGPSLSPFAGEGRSGLPLPPAGEGRGEGRDWSENEGRPRSPRPLMLLPAPEPVQVIAPLPEGPPVLFRWRRISRRVAAAAGPERIGPEWWREAAGYDPERLSRIRDYYRIEDEMGGRWWLYREGLYRPDRSPRWYLHGMFG